MSHNVEGSGALASGGCATVTCSSPNGSLVVSRRACASSETESEAGDIMEQQLEEMNKQLNSVTDPTGFLRMVRHNNLLHRYGARPHARGAPSTGHGAQVLSGRCRSKPGASPWCQVHTEVEQALHLPVFDTVESRDTLLLPCQVRADCPASGRS